MKSRSILILIWSLFLVRGSFYAAVVPLWEGLDEFAHFAYVHHLAEFGILPRPDEKVSEEVSTSLQLVPLPWALRDWPEPAATHDKYWKLPEAERSRRESALGALAAESQARPGTDYLYEGKQPPLYYLLCAPVLKLIGGESLATRVFLLRLLTLLITSLVIPFTFAVAMRVFGDSVPALLAATLVAVMPILSMTASRIGNDGLAIALFSVLAWALLRTHPWDWRGCLLIGTVLGAGLLTKAYFVACIPVLVGAGVLAIWRATPQKRTRVAVMISASALLAMTFSAWWYLRILSVPGPVWVDAVPAANYGALELLVRMPWEIAVKGALDMHFWIAGWSFLSLRSWIYLILRWGFLFAILGSFLAMLRSLPALRPIWGLYAGFWAAMMYHSLVTFANSGTPSITGHYLYAVVACESVILCSGIRRWLPRAWQGRAMLLCIGLFLLLEAYATHFVLIPYYTGLIQHRPDTSLMTFYISQLFDMGGPEVLRRLAFNKPVFMNPSAFGILWAAFLAASAGLFLQACRLIRGVSSDA
jgi:hypothetical protein